MSDLRVRWVDEDLPIEDTFDSACHDLAKLGRQIDDGELLYKCALVEKCCDACGHWELVDSLGACCAPPASSFWSDTEKELLELDAPAVRKNFGALKARMGNVREPRR